MLDRVPALRLILRHPRHLHVQAARYNKGSSNPWPTLARHPAVPSAYELGGSGWLSHLSFWRVTFTWNTSSSARATCVLTGGLEDRGCMAIPLYRMRNLNEKGSPRDATLALHLVSACSTFSPRLTPNMRGSQFSIRQPFIWRATSVKAIVCRLVTFCCLKWLALSTTRSARMASLSHRTVGQ